MNTLKTYLCVALLLLAIQFDGTHARQSLRQESQFIGDLFKKFIEIPVNMFKGATSLFTGGQQIPEPQVVIQPDPPISCFDARGRLIRFHSQDGRQNFNNFNPNNFNNGGHNINSIGRNANNGGHNIHNVGQNPNVAGNNGRQPLNNAGQNIANGGQVNSSSQNPSHASQEANNAGENRNVAHLGHESHSPDSSSENSTTDHE